MLVISSPQLNSPSLAASAGKCPGYTDTGKYSLDCDTGDVILTELGPRITKKTPVPSSSWSWGPGDVAMLQPPSARHPPCRSRGWFFPCPFTRPTLDRGNKGNAARKNIFGFIGFILMNLYYRFTEVKLEYVDVWVMLKSFFDTRKFGDQWSFIVVASSLFSKTVCEIILMVWIKNLKSSRREGIDIDCPQIQFRPDSNLV